MAELSFTMIALALAAGLALFLGMVGLYGILSSTVAERTRELGIRIALGAQPGRVRRMVVAQGLRVVAVGVLVGLIAARARRARARQPALRRPRARRRDARGDVAADAARRRGGELDPCVPRELGRSGGDVGRELSVHSDLRARAPGLTGSAARQVQIRISATAESRARCSSRHRAALRRCMSCRKQASTCRRGPTAQPRGCRRPRGPS